MFLTKLIHYRYRVIKDMFILLCFGLTCTFAYQAVEEERFLEQYLLSSFVIMQVSHMTIHYSSLVVTPRHVKCNVATEDYHSFHIFCDHSL